MSDLVDGLDLAVFYAPYEGDGRRNVPYESRMMNGICKQRVMLDTHPQVNPRRVPLSSGAS